MYLRKAFENDSFIRLENVEHDSLTVYIEGTNAYILSVMVSFLSRGMSRGSELMTAMEGYLYNKGIKTIRSVYSSKLLNVNDLLEVCGFSVVEGASLISRDAMDLLSEPKVLNMISSNNSKKSFVPLSKLDANATGKLIYFLKQRIRPFPMTYLSVFLQDVSGVVFDDKNRIAGVILCSKYGECLHLDYVLTPSEKGSP
ncbi:MAG: hypothetical protein J6N76_05120, partial [Lachnospiraceae bacterium]|nr:hypothetical protein [Lachnospiraceae bacterium]